MTPFLDLKSQYADIKDDVDAAIQDVLDNCGYILGPEVAQFEEEFAAYSDLGYTARDFPHSERAADEVLSLPMFPELTVEQCETVAAPCASSRPASSRTPSRH